MASSACVINALAIDQRCLSCKRGNAAASARRTFGESSAAAMMVMAATASEPGGPRSTNKRIDQRRTCSLSWSNRCVSAASSKPSMTNSVHKALNLCTSSSSFSKMSLSCSEAADKSCPAAARSWRILRACRTNHSLECRWKSTNSMSPWSCNSSAGFCGDPNTTL